ncbi:hypothetical protein GCM10010269_31150 [Streptomyces humidus]|uniref:Uncharacterized protein n=1 Tax=Streptomyces humidus TaxID=52259 RepID=A0A918FWG5_9ACTN|nr:hypothetical protein [Streptomyces humidus]GGR89801.1 hypothetical protein GCM10010269_31150 [Streptomyces humidus]
MAAFIRGSIALLPAARPPGRPALHDSLPDGHVHTQVRQFTAVDAGPATGRATGPRSVRDRPGVVARVRAIPTS